MEEHKKLSCEVIKFIQIIIFSFLYCVESHSVTRTQNSPPYLVDSRLMRRYQTKVRDNEAFVRCAEPSSKYSIVRLPFNPATFRTLEIALEYFMSLKTSAIPESVGDTTDTGRVYLHATNLMKSISRMFIDPTTFICPRNVWSMPFPVMNTSIVTQAVALDDYAALELMISRSSEIHQCYCPRSGAHLLQYAVQQRAYRCLIVMLLSDKFNVYEKGRVDGMTAWDEASYRRDYVARAMIENRLLISKCSDTKRKAAIYDYPSLRAYNEESFDIYIVPGEVDMFSSPHLIDIMSSGYLTVDSDVSSRSKFFRWLKPTNMSIHTSWSPSSFEGFNMENECLKCCECSLSVIDVAGCSKYRRNTLSMMVCTICGRFVCQKCHLALDEEQVRLVPLPRSLGVRAVKVVSMANRAEEGQWKVMILSNEPLQYGVQTVQVVQNHQNKDSSLCPSCFEVCAYVYRNRSKYL